MVRKCVVQSLWTSCVDGNRGASIFVAERLHVQDFAKSFAERLKRQVQQGLGNASVAVLHLPQIPNAIDHAVMSVKDWIERRCGNVHHVSAYPYVHIIVETLQAIRK